VQLRDAVFEFSEVISEQATGRSSLAQLVFVSPSSGDAQVRWRRTSIAVRPRGGWRDNTTYVVTLLPGVADLRGNVRDTATVLVFSTADSIPDTRLRGVVFDWARGDVAPRALVQARPSSDTTLVYSAEADSLGRFSLPFLSPGEYLVQAIVDANRNRAADPREPWDSVRVQLRDTLTRELFAFVQDTSAPRVTSVTVLDSLTLRVALDGPLRPATALAGIASVFTADSLPVAIARVAPWPEMGEERAALDRARRDSIARADTSEAARIARDRRFRDSVNRAAAIADSIARDTTAGEPRPSMNRPRLVTEIGISLAEPLEPATPYRLRLELAGILGGERVAQSIFSRPRPDVPPGARTDTTTRRPSHQPNPSP
jgi:hypothetical protein